MRKVLIINKDDKRSTEIAYQLADELGKYNVEGLPEDYANTREAEDVDATIVIGGDGSILKSRLNFPNHIPILGINTGHAGYLSEIQPPRIPEVVKRLVEKDYKIEYLTQIQAKYNDQVSTLALNDIMIYPIMATSMLKAKVYVNGTHVNDVQADGIIVATPTGSTAYSLSAGGSVLTNDSKALIITPIAPYKPFDPLVVPETAIVELEINREYNESFIKVDGAIWQMMDSFEKVQIFKGKPKPFIRLGYTSFYEKIRGRHK